MWSRTLGTSPRTPPGGGTVESMAPTAFEPVADRVVERRRAVALARHYREAEGLSIGQIADRLGRSPATIKAYFYDPTGEKARAVKARYQGVCRGCGAYTQPRNGKGEVCRSVMGSSCRTRANVALSASDHASSGSRQ